MQVLRNLQGQLTGFHFLIDFLKLFRETNSLISVGIRSQILDPKNETGNCFCAVVNWIYYRTFEGFLCLKLCPFSLQILKIFFIVSEWPTFTTFYISMSTFCRRLICIETESSFSRSSWQVNFLLLYINLRQCFCIRFSLLFNARLWNIHTRGQ